MKTFLLSFSSNNSVTHDFADCILAVPQVTTPRGRHTKQLLREITRGGGGIRRCVNEVGVVSLRLKLQSDAQLVTALVEVLAVDERRQSQSDT